MADFVVFPDLEAVVRTKIAAAGYRAYSSIPNSPTWPLCVVSRAGGYPAVRRYLDNARIQVDVWGGAKGDPSPTPKSTIQDMAQDVRVKLVALEGTKVTSPVGAFITCVEDGELQWLPDQDTGRDRYILLLEIYGRSLLPGE